MAAVAGISEASVRRIWRSHGLKPHRVETFKLSNDARFAERLEDIVGLYRNPPEYALSLDEKSQIQALDRTQPGLPMKKGRVHTMTHDYKRHGTTTLFAALNTLDGSVMATCMERHRHQEWLKFLRLIDRQTPADKQLHLIVDNYATHKHPAVLRWAARHKRFHFHFTPTSSSWLNMVERFFHDLNIPSFQLLFRGHAAAREEIPPELLERAIGVIYLPETERLSHYFLARLSDQFDAVLHFDETRAVEPLPHAEAEQTAEVPETYPVGV